MQGSAGFAYLSNLVDWSLSDRGQPDQMKIVAYERDSGDAGWRADYRAVRSLEPLELAGDPDNARFRAKSMNLDAWHAVGADDLVRFTAMAGRVSRRAAYAVVLPGKTRAGFAAAELSWEHDRDWSLSAGLYREGGWGGRSIENDVIHLTNGEPAAARGIHAEWRFALAGEEGGARSSWLGIDAHSGSRGAGLGQPMRHDSDVSLVLTSLF